MSEREELARVSDAIRTLRNIPITSDAADEALCVIRRGMTILRKDMSRAIFYGQIDSEEDAIRLWNIVQTVAKAREALQLPIVVRSPKIRTT